MYQKQTKLGGDIPAAMFPSTSILLAMDPSWKDAYRRKQHYWDPFPARICVFELKSLNLKTFPCFFALRNKHTTQQPHITFILPQMSLVDYGADSSDEEEVQNDAGGKVIVEIQPASKHRVTSNTSVLSVFSLSLTAHHASGKPASKLFSSLPLPQSAKDKVSKLKRVSFATSYLCVCECYRVEKKKLHSKFQLTSRQQRTKNWMRMKMKKKQREKGRGQPQMVSTFRH